MSSYGWERLEPDVGVVVVELSGELDLTNARELEQRLLSACPPDDVLVVDLGGVYFLDSAALHVLFKLVRARSRDRLVLLLDPDSRIAATISLVGLDLVVEVRQELGPGPSESA